MNMSVNGSGNLNSRPTMTGTLTVKSVNDSKLRMAGMRRTENKVKKRLNYNHREISGQILRAKKSQSASTVATRAKSKLAVLQRAAGTGQYDSREVANAIAHARRMVRCAQLKVRNLKEEEREQRKSEKTNGAETQQRKSEVKRRVAQKEQQLKNKAAIKEIQQVQREKSKRLEMARKRQMHRNTERAKVNEADMKYIKRELEEGRGYPNSCQSMDQSVFLEMSGLAAAMAEAQMMQQAEQQIVQEAEAEVEAEMAMETGGESGISGGITISTSAAGGDVAAGTPDVTGSVDISI